MTSSSAPAVRSKRRRVLRRLRETALLGLVRGAATTAGAAAVTALTYWLERRL